MWWNGNWPYFWRANVDIKGLVWGTAGWMVDLFDLVGETFLRQYLHVKLPCIWGFSLTCESRQLQPDLDHLSTVGEFLKHVEFVDALHIIFIHSGPQSFTLKKTHEKVRYRRISTSNLICFSFWSSYVSFRAVLLIFHCWYLDFWLYSLPETNMFAPENRWLEDSFPFG